MVEILFLGTGGAFSAGSRSNLALWIKSGDFRMLVEAGPPVMHQLATAGVPATEITRLFVSHCHGDHVLGFPMLALTLREMGLPLQVYAGRHTVASLDVLCALVYPSLATERPGFTWHTLSEQGPDERDLGDGVRLRTAVVPHPPGIPTLACRWDFAGGQSVVFVTDTTPNQAVVELAHGGDLLVHEASFSAVLQPGHNAANHHHSTARQAGEVARRAGCRRLALVHLGPQIGVQPDVLVEEARGGTDLDVVVPADGESLVVP